MEADHVRPGVSVVICCYNSSPRIEETLRHLAFQKADNVWEIVLVDNGSTDHTAAHARAYWQSYGPENIPLSVVTERNPGLSNARTAGVKKAAYDVVIFCDDDNWLPANYLSTALDTLRRETSAAVAGGWCDGVYEIPLKEYLIPMTGALAIGKHGRTTGKSESVNGAGMIFRKSVYEEILMRSGDSLLQDRKGKQLTSGGDTELCWRARYLGYDVVVDEKLYFQHYMPKNRLHARYFFRLCLLNVSPIIILSQYRYRFSGTTPSFAKFWREATGEAFRQTAYCFPRMFLGKFKFHSLIYFLQSWKVILLLTVRSRKFRSSYRTIDRLKNQLAPEQ